MTTGIPALRPYQQQPARAITDSILHQRGLTFTVEMARQSGKNELSAQLETALLAAFAPGLGIQEATIIKAAPTFNPQVKISLRRLADSLRRTGIPYRPEEGHILRVGPHQIIFLSGEPTANVVGHTANPLLEIDEAQDFDIDKYDKEFRPMAAANNATTVLYGTAWSELDLLHRERLRALQLARHDQVQRAFIIPWTVPAAILPAYARFVADERERLGPNNPMFTSQYDLKPIPSKGRLFDATTLSQLLGEHPRRTTPPPFATIAAGLDVAGGGDDQPGTHDRTVLTIGAVAAPPALDILPANHVAVLHHIAWQGLPHEQLLPQLIDLIINIWKPTALTVDATGLGETTARILTQCAHRTDVTTLKFTRPTKSLLGYQLLAAASTGRLKIYADDSSAERTTCWHELTKARADYLPGHHMNFYVDPTEGHDDYLISLALLQHAAEQATPRIARGRSATPS